VSTVSRAALQTDIADRLTKAGEVPQSVTCKSGLDGEIGALAQCEVESGGAKVRRTVEVNRVEG
jgi:hypothetical protein